MRIGKKIAVAAIGALTLVVTAFATTQEADARPFGGGAFHGGGFRGGFNRGFGYRGFYGPRFGFGFAYPYYAYSDYGYGACFIQRRVFVSRFGYRFVRPVRVCV